jgi:hypothetical protein
MKGRAALVLAAAGLASVPVVALAVDRNFAGSAQLDYHLVPSQPGAAASGLGIDGFTAEVAFKVVADVNDRLSAAAKVCYGCHGFEMAMAYFDYRLFDQLSFRAGRFSPSFGAFNLRHDPANQALSSKPLPYDMGRMLRTNDWNMGVLPSPFPDTGVEVGGSQWFGERLQVDYAAYAVSGFKAEPGSLDLQWSRSFSGFSGLDNNSRPALGARAALTARLGAESDATLGGSYMQGSYDADRELGYRVAGMDLSLRLAATHLRFEYLWRQHELEVQPGQQLGVPRDPGTREMIEKEGAYIELVHPATPWLEAVVRVDGLRRDGNTFVDGSLQPRSRIIRYTAGAVLWLSEGWRVKASAEWWQFSEATNVADRTELGLHLATVGTF